MTPQRIAPVVLHPAHPRADAAPHPRSHRLAALAALGGLSLAAGCVTINIYFPAAAAEKAADRIIDEVYQLRRDATPVPKPPEAPATK